MGGSRGRREGPLGTQGVKADPRSPLPPIPGNWNPHGLVGVGGGVSKPVGRDTCGQYTCCSRGSQPRPRKTLGGRAGAGRARDPALGHLAGRPFQPKQPSFCHDTGTARRPNNDGKAKATYPTPSRPTAPLPDWRPWLGAAKTLCTRLCVSLYVSGRFPGTNGRADGAEARRR